MTLSLDSSNEEKRGLRIRDVAAYALLPKILPRIGSLFFSGFSYFGFFVAQVYRGVRLLPADHPSLNPQNIGQYSVRAVVMEAARHLVWRRDNIDQIIVFLAILAGLVLLVLQVCTFIVALAMPHALAGSINSNLSGSGFGFSSIFGTPFNDGSQDISYILLDRVFGVPGIFNSCITGSGTACYGVQAATGAFDKVNTVYKPTIFPWPYHEGLHALFKFYSMGLLLVAVFILLYFVIVIVAETAQTGTPFGKRFNTVWAPIRLVMAFGLLIPITNGLNSAQYITLYAAKWGSNFASNGWIVFNKTIATSAKDQANAMAFNSNLAVKPKEPEVSGLLQFMTLAQTCKVFEETIMADNDPVLTQPETTTGTTGTTSTTNSCNTNTRGRYIDAYIVKQGLDPSKSYKLLRDVSYKDAIAFTENQDIRIRFGDRNCDIANYMAANVAPTCGEITVPVNSLTAPGAVEVQEGYYNLIKYLWGGYKGNGTDNIASYWNDASDGVTKPERNACVSTKYQTVLDSGVGSYDKAIRTYALSYFQNGGDKLSTGQCNRNEKTDTNIEYTNLLPPPPVGWAAAANEHYLHGNDGDTETDVNTKSANYSGYDGGKDQDVIVRNIIKNGVLALTKAANSTGTDNPYAMSDDNLRRGWAVAGIWYNKIAEMNGALVGAAWDLPTANRYPQIMMEVLAEKRQNNVTVDAGNMWTAEDASGTMRDKLRNGDYGVQYATTMAQVAKQWGNVQPKESTGNILSDFVNMIFGTQGLFDLRYEQNNRAHPLAMLVGVGKGLIEASIRNLELGGASGMGAVFASLMGGKATPELLLTLSSFLVSIATMTLTAGFILFYVIPFLPFLYFFFAVGNWLKGVFEAMVGVPLWALAHIRIDGEGLPGDAAANGYFMIFEIFLRPILIIFGFLASITIFSAMATVLHEIFEVAVSNLTGSGTSGGATGAIDKFFYTVMYAVIMYIMALSSFKLIDLIPNQLMRWMGTSVSTFSDMNGDPAGNLTQMTAFAGSQMTQQLAGGVQGAMKGMSDAGQKFSQGMQQNIGKAQQG